MADPRDLSDPGVVNLSDPRTIDAEIQESEDREGERARSFFPSVRTVPPSLRCGSSLSRGSTPAYFLSPQGQHNLDTLSVAAGVYGAQAADAMRNMALSESKADGADDTQGTESAQPAEGVYEFPDAQSPGRTYVGQSQDIDRRLPEHERNGKKNPAEEAKRTEVKGGRTSREVAEQRRINELGGTKAQPGSKTSNVRNPIGPKRQDLMKEQNQ